MKLHFVQQSTCQTNECCDRRCILQHSSVFVRPRFQHDFPDYVLYSPNSLEVSTPHINGTMSHCRSRLYVVNSVTSLSLYIDLINTKTITQLTETDDIHSLWLSLKIKWNTPTSNPVVFFEVLDYSFQKLSRNLSRSPLSSLQITSSHVLWLVSRVPLSTYQCSFTLSFFFSALYQSISFLLSWLTLHIISLHDMIFEIMLWYPAPKLFNPRFTSSVTSWNHSKVQKSSLQRRRWDPRQRKELDVTCLQHPSERTKER